MKVSVAKYMWCLNNVVSNNIGLTDHLSGRPFSPYAAEFDTTIIPASGTWRKDGWIKGVESLTPYFAQYIIRYMLQIFDMPGPSALKGDCYWFFLTPLLDGLQDLSKRGMVVE